MVRLVGLVYFQVKMSILRFESTEPCFTATHSFNTPSPALIGEIDKLGSFTVYEEEKLVIVKDVHFPKSAD